MSRRNKYYEPVSNEMQNYKFNKKGEKQQTSIIHYWVNGTLFYRRMCINFKSPLLRKALNLMFEEIVSGCVMGSHAIHGATVRVADKY